MAFLLWSRFAAASDMLCNDWASICERPEVAVHLRKVIADMEHTAQQIRIVPLFRLFLFLFLFIFLWCNFIILLIRVLIQPQRSKRQASRLT